MCIDGFPLSISAAGRLQRLLTVTAEAQARALSSQRTPMQVLSKSVIAAFRSCHRVKHGAWEPCDAVTLSSGLQIVGGCM